MTTSDQRLFLVHLAVVCITTVAVVVVDRVLQTAWSWPFLAGGLMMAAEIYLFEKLALIVLAPEGTTSAKKALIALLLPLKFFLFAIPVLVYLEFGRPAMLPFIAGLLTIVISGLWVSHRSR